MYASPSHGLRPRALHNIQKWRACSIVALLPLLVGLHMKRITMRGVSMIACSDRNGVYSIALSRIASRALFASGGTAGARAVVDCCGELISIFSLPIGSRLCCSVLLRSLEH